MLIKKVFNFGIFIIILLSANILFANSHNVNNPDQSCKLTVLYILFSVTSLSLIYILITRNKAIKIAVKKQSEIYEDEINHNKKLLRELEINKNQLNLMFKYSPIGIAIRDVEGKLIDINQAYADMLGYSLKELKDGIFDNVSYEPDVKKSEDAYQNLLNGKDSIKLEKRLEKSDGSLIHVIQRIVLVRDHNQVPLFLIGMTVDITDMVLAIKQLEESEEFYQEVLSNMSGFVYKCANDKDWTMLYLNHQIEDISGYPPSDFINNNIRSYASIIHPDDRNDVFQAVQDAINNHTPFKKEYRIIHKDGSIVWVYEEGRGIFDEKGELLYLSGTIIDFTEKKEIESKLQEYNVHLEEKVKLRTKEIKDQYKKLEKVHKLFIGREFRIKELRDQVKELKRQLKID